MDCREGCGACCIAPSISSSMPGLPEGKPSGVPCKHLDEDYKCRLFGDSSRPEVCDKFLPEEIICGSKREEALENLYKLENWLED